MKKTEFEKMQRAKMCIDKLANGIDPLTDNEMTDDRTLNDLYTSRCHHIPKEGSFKVGA